MALLVPLVFFDSKARDVAGSRHANSHGPGLVEAMDLAYLRFLHRCEKIYNWVHPW